MADSSGEHAWEPTQGLQRAVVVRSFLPLKRYPNLAATNDHFCNLYAGDELYVFETTADRKWLRAYLCVIPLPESYISLARSGSLNDGLPQIGSKLVIVPRRFVSFSVDYEVSPTSFLKMPNSADLNADVSPECKVPSLYDSYSANDVTAKSGTKPSRPPFPFIRYQRSGLVDELNAAQGLLSAHIYRMYSMGEFFVYRQMTLLYHQLDSITLRLKFGLVTQTERTKVIRSATALLTNISKLISTKTKSKSLNGPSSSAFNPQHSDPAGFESVFARDADTGELLSYKESSLHKLMVNTMLQGLSKEFPVSNRKLFEMEVPPNPLFDSSQSHILVDVTDVTSDASIGNPLFNNLTASMYLSTKKEVLTEPFTVNIDSEHILSLNNISAALFKNLPDSKTQRNNIYLVVVLTEKIPIKTFEINPESKAADQSPFIPFSLHASGASIGTVTRGVAAGAVDITRVFSKYNNSFTPTENSFKFKIYLFGSYFVKPKHDENKPNQPITGWGALLDNILSNSLQGVAVNPRATSLSVSVKEINGEAASQRSMGSLNSVIKSVNTHFYDIMSQERERIYLQLGKVSFCNIAPGGSNVKNVTIRMSSNNRGVFFSRGSTETPFYRWQFVSVEPGEPIGDSVKIHGIENMREEESIKVLAYLNGVLMAKADLTIKRHNQIVEYKKYSTIELLNPHKEPLLNLEVQSEYVGYRYNMDPKLQKFLNIQSYYKTDNAAFQQDCTNVFAGLKSVSINQFEKYFAKILQNFADLFYLFAISKKKEFPDSLSAKTFASFVTFIDKILTHNEGFRYSFSKFYKKLLKSSRVSPSIGFVILDSMADVFSKSHETWDSVGSAVARNSIYLLMLSVAFSRGMDATWRQSFERVFSQVCEFMTDTSDKTVVDQTAILEQYDLWLDCLTLYYPPEEIVQFTLALLQSCRNKEENLDFFIKRLSAREEKYANTKFSLLRRLLVHRSLHDYLFVTGVAQRLRLIFLTKCIEWTLQPYAVENIQLDTARLGNGVLITIVESTTDRMLQRNLLRLLPTLCKVFLNARKHCQENNFFKPKITFTRLFPFSMPCTVHSMDSLIKKEIVVEPLLEIVTIICEILKIAEKLYGANASYTEILEECGNKELHSKFFVQSISALDIFSLYHVIGIALKGGFFPAKKWLGVSAMIMRSLMTLLIMYRDCMTKGNGLNTVDKNDAKLMAAYLKSLFLLANHKTTFLVDMAILPRKAVYLITGDSSERAAKLLEFAWEAIADEEYDHDCAKRFGFGKIGANQLALLDENVPLIGEMMVFGAHDHFEAIKVSCKVLWYTIINFWMAYGALKPILDATIPELYNNYTTGRLRLTDDELKKLKLSMFYTIHISPEDKSYESVVIAMEELFSFLQLIADADKIPDEAEFDDDRTAVHMEMFGYLMDANRPELFQKMIYHLFIQFTKKKDYVQAALSLELLANTFDWNPNNRLMAISAPPMPEQSSFERKEYLYKEAAFNFSKGLKLEKALSLYKDLTTAYDHINYDLSGLAFVHNEISNLYTSMQTVDRLVPTFFKVSFAGLGFPSSLRNKIFIFEGMPFEHITSMCNRLLKLHHGSSIVQRFEQLEELFVKPKMGKFIHISSVEPQLEFSDEYQSQNDRKGKFNYKTWLYVENKNMKTFSNSRKLPGPTSVTDLWVDEYTYETASTFPTLMNRSEVLKVAKNKLSPLENAMRSLRLKIQELSGLADMCYKVYRGHEDQTMWFNELSRNLTGTIDAPVNGGMTQYREFLKEPVASQFDANELGNLTRAFNDLAIVLAHCLNVHRELLPSEQLKDSHNMLVVLFKKNFEPEIKKNHINFDSTSLTSTQSHGSSSFHFRKNPFAESSLDPSLEYSEAVSENGSDLQTRSLAQSRLTWNSNSSPPMMFRKKSHQRW
ncbi:YLR422W [Zygosaccharomyces parabailii]|nr:YLR422W [Zygosaccharomyces parabailii]